MKIGILTFFESDNYGTVLQAYALQSYLEDLGHSAILIHLKRNVNAKSVHFKPAGRKYTLKQRIWNHIIIQKTAKMSEYKKEKFRKFREEYLNITSVCYESEKDFLEDMHNYDLFISGGDQIWNPCHKVFSLNYMLKFLPEGYPRISYGSSFGVDVINDEIVLAGMANALKKYAEISVREASGVEIVSQMGLEAHRVVDPVFLCGNKWHDWVDKESPVRKKYGVIYALIDYADECDAKIKKYAKDNHLKMIILPENRRNCMNGYKKCFDLSPIEFINYIAHSEIVFTNSFHGLAFAILFHKKVVILNPVSEEAKSKQSRLLNLLETIGIEQRDFESLNDSIDYEKVQMKLDEMINESKDYLVKAIEGN